jgi:protein-L-isoaspartate(D-aspartate) O-methyltransferase
MNRTATGHSSADDFSRQRESMVEHQLVTRGLQDQRVLDAMRRVPREHFMPPADRDSAYHDGPFPIGHGQTISQPYTVAFCCEALELLGSEKVLEVGTGSGYAACVLARLAAEVHSIERIPELAESARQRIAELGVNNVHIHVGDGSLGLPAAAPFDAIVVAAGGPSLPRAFAEQLSEGGRIVMPVGPMHMQRMMRYTKRDWQMEQEDLGPFSFVPLIGAEAWANE